MPARLVTREDLRQILWPSDTFVDFDHSLNTAVMKLRACNVTGSTVIRQIFLAPRKVPHQALVTWSNVHCHYWTVLTLLLI